MLQVPSIMFDAPCIKLQVPCIMFDAPHIMLYAPNEITFDHLRQLWLSIWWADFFNRASEIYSPHKEQSKTWLLDELKMLKFGVSRPD